ncbi:MAG: gamma carbonic anhydrase family protein [Gammaproteobacteria bacterium]|nr:MAG: gamma carbonic anhydrase family protein [Gammaproteobacteria bacterium]
MAIRRYAEYEPDIATGVFVDETALVLGQVALAEDVSVWPMAVIRGDVHRIDVGPRTNVQDGAVLHVTHDHPQVPGGHPLIIGADVTIGHRAVLHACRVEPVCLIGIGAVVMDGAVVGEHSLVAAGSLVPPGKRLPAGFLWKGSPVKQDRRLNAAEIDYLRYSAAHYVRLKEGHRHV